MGLGALDQVTSSVSNIVIVFAIARVSDVEAFGLIGFVMAGVSTALAASRGLLGTPIALLSHDEEALQREAALAATVAAAVGSASGLVIAFAAAGTKVAAEGVLFGLALPLVLMQDVGRFKAIAGGRPGRALLSDGVWAVGSCAALAWTAIRPHTSAVHIVLVWSSLAALACLIVMAATSLAPSVRGVWAWLRHTAEDRVRYGGEATIGAVTSLAVVTIAAWTLSSEAVAALRGAGSILGPLSVLMTAITLALVPELRRRGGSVSAARAWVHLRKVSIALSGLALLIGLMAWLLPAALGEAILGSSWRVVHPLLPITSLEYASLAWLTSCAAGLRAQGRSRELLNLRLTLTGLTLILSSVGALVVHQVWAVAGGLALAAAISATVGRSQLLRDP